MRERGPQQPRVSENLMRVFAAYSRRYLHRRFHTLRVLKNGLPRRDGAGPLVIYLNHSAWWDPLVCVLLSREYFPGHTSYAPIDLAMLDRYGFFKHLGFFGVEQRRRRGARTFLETAHTLLSSAGNALWLTPQGRFVDVRERPLRLQGGLGALAAREPHATFLPLAIEYSFWMEPRPEILVAFGDSIVPRLEPARSAADWSDVLSDALEATQDELAARSCRRDAVEWFTLNRGQVAVNGVYDAWRWLRARVRGEKFTPEHHAEEVP